MGTRAGAEFFIGIGRRAASNRAKRKSTCHSGGGTVKRKTNSSHRAKSREDEVQVLRAMACPCIGCGQPTNLAAHDITGFCKPCGDALEREEEAL